MTPEIDSLRARLAAAEARAESKHGCWMSELKRLSEAEATIAQLTQDRDAARAEVADLAERLTFFVNECDALKNSLDASNNPP